MGYDCGAGGFRGEEGEDGMIMIPLSAIYLHSMYVVKMCHWIN